MKPFAIMGAAIFGAIAIPTALVAQKRAVTTYHYDNQRTGWNQQETTLTPANVGPTSFGVIAQVVLDDQVDAQPLLVPGQPITAGLTPGTYQVVYVATEGNTIYAIRASNGAVLLSRNLGTPVPTPLGCPSGAGPNVGINSTPVIDVAANALYVVAYTLISGNPTYQLFALHLNDLTDKIPPVTIAASHMLSDGTTYNFNATYERQRPGLLLSSGNIYAGFGSFCDTFVGQTRGWLLGWQASTLAPLANNKLTDTLNTANIFGQFFLSSIWMSGYGIAAAPSSGNLFFSTGNSGPGSYDGVNNIQESVVKMDSQMVNVLGIFTPSDVITLDSGDGDLSSGGVLLLPTQPGPFPTLAVAAGKAGTMYLLNRASLGGLYARRPRQRTRRTNDWALLVRALLFHRSGRGRAGRKQRRRGKHRRRPLEPRRNRRLADTDLAHGCLCRGRCGGACRQRPGWRNLYDGFVERHPSWNSHHMGDGATDH